MDYKGTRKTKFEKVLQLELLNRKGGFYPEVWHTLSLPTTTSQDPLSVSILLSERLSSELCLSEMSLIPGTATKPQCYTTKLKNTRVFSPSKEGPLPFWWEREAQASYGSLSSSLICMLGQCFCGKRLPWTSSFCSGLLGFDEVKYFKMEFLWLDTLRSHVWAITFTE